jgi:hypothetical protein
MPIIKCDLPTTSVLDRRVVDAAWFRDSYRAPLRDDHATMPAIFFSLFGHLPGWIKAVLITRNRVASWCGLNVPTPSSITSPTIKDAYQVGDTIGPWPIYALSATELVAGRDNSHLDFRLSLLRVTSDGRPGIVVSTICTVHGWKGKLYLLFIVPFHKWGVKRLMATAVAAGRL